MYHLNLPSYSFSNKPLFFFILGEMFLEPLIAGREQRFSSLRRPKFHPPISSLLGCSAMPTAVQDYVLIGRSTAIYC